MIGSTAEAGISAAIEAEVVRDRVRALYAHRPQALLVLLVFSGVFVFAFSGKVPSAPMGAWLLSVLVVQVTGWTWLRRFRRMAQGAGWDGLSELRRFTWQAWLSAMVLGMAGWVFYHPDLGDIRWLTVCLLCSLAAGTVTVYAYHVPTYQGFLVLLALPLAVRFWVNGAPGGGYVYAMGGFFLLMMSVLSVKQGNILVAALRLRHEKSRMAELLAARRQELEAANQAKARFFAAASHDLRQPLHALGFYAGLLRPTADDEPTVARIHQCIDSLDGLLEGVLTISRLDAGKVARHLEPVDLGVLLRRLVTLHEGLAQAKRLRLGVRVPLNSARGCWVLSDPVLLERILNNLLSNALRYTANGGVLLAARPCAGGWQAQVYDTGQGIAEDSLGAIFDEFVQLNNPMRDPAQGVGLGLATVRRLCALLEHRLTVRSKLGKGSVFTLHLPAALPTPADPPRLSESGPGFTGTALLLEDDPLARESLALMLEEWGLRVTDCGTPEQALMVAAEQVFSVVISDWRLPGKLNGIEFLDRVSNLPGCAKALRLLITGETPESLGPLPPGVSVMQKPLKPLRLRAVLSAHLAVVVQGLG